MTVRLECKAAFDVDDAGLITGRAWDFSTPDRCGDVIVKGAFSAAGLPLPMLFAHDPIAAVGVWNGFAETDAGLEVQGRLLVDDVARAREVRALVKAGAVTGLSIGFIPGKTAPRKGGGRTIKKANLVEISLVPVPAHPRARVTSVKSAAVALTLADAINRATAALRRK